MDAATFVEPSAPADDGLTPHADTSSARAVAITSKVVARTTCCRGDVERDEVVDGERGAGRKRGGDDDCRPAHEALRGTRQIGSYEDVVHLGR